RFNLAYHIRHTQLPKPGDERQLKRLAGRLMSQQLDRGKPLWEMWVVEGLEGNRFAIVTKIHHCMIDGVGGAELMGVVMRAVAEDEWAHERRRRDGFRGRRLRPASWRSARCSTSSRSRSRRWEP